MKTNDVFERVAKQNNTTADEVYAEIQKAIDAAFYNPDPLVQAEWAKIPYKGNKPTPEDVIAYAVNVLQNKKGH